MAQARQGLIRVVHAPQDELDPALAAGLARITALAWAGADERHDPLLRPELFVLEEDGRVLAGLGVLTKDLEHGGRTWCAAGLSAVVTDPAERRRGRASTLAAAARIWLLDDLGADVGLFTCDRPTAEVYVRGGWTVVPGAVLVGGTAARPFPSDGPGMDKVVLGAWPRIARPETRRAFEGERVLLHPGEIDRLW